MSPKRLSRARRAALWPALALVALAPVGCGTVAVQPTTPSGAEKLASRGKLDDPATDMHNHVACLRGADLPVQVLSPIKLQVGPAPAGPTIVFTPSPAVAQAYQIRDFAPGAEVIGSALVYPNQGSDGELASIGACLAQGVQQ
jgi:hypothetical protein